MNTELNLKELVKSNSNTKVKSIKVSNTNQKLKRKIRTKSKTKSFSSLLSSDLNVNIKKSLYPKVSKLVAIGDIHGDLVVAIKALKLAKVIDDSISNTTKDINKINWCGGNTIVVQLGDQIDRVRPNELVNELCAANDSELNQDEGSDLKIICLFEKLHQQAIKQNGALFSILGNHELMNIEGDFRYVSPKEFKEFGTFFKEKKEEKGDMPYGYNSRKRVFQPGGVLSKKLANTRYSILQIGSWIFVHGGIGPKLAQDYTINDINYNIKQWLLGNSDPTIKHHINTLYNNDDDTYSPFWTRVFSDLDEWNEEYHTKLFKKTLELLNKKNKRTSRNQIKGMIVGHSPQFMYNKCLNSSCDNALWRVDVGASRAFGLFGGKKQNYNRKVQVLEIKNDREFNILREK